jgi:hypothetical protein
MLLTFRVTYTNWTNGGGKTDKQSRHLFGAEKCGNKYRRTSSIPRPFWCIFLSWLKILEPVSIYERTINLNIHQGGVFS